MVADERRAPPASSTPPTPSSHASGAIQGASASQGLIRGSDSIIFTPVKASTPAPSITMMGKRSVSLSSSVLPQTTIGTLISSPSTTSR